MRHPRDTMFLSTADVIAIVRRLGVAACLDRMARRIEADFRRWPEFTKQARVGHHSDTGVIELMPISDARAYSFKYVNGHPGNPRHGLPTVMAFGVLADMETGQPVLLSELTLTTALRTAATSAMAARFLARPDSRTMALIGNGAQSEFQALAFHHLLGVDRLRLFDTEPQATAKLVRNLANVPGMTLEVCSSVAEAVRGADIVTTVTADKANATVVTPDMIAPGMHLNAVGGDCPGKTELHADVLRAGPVFVEFEPQSRIEGEIQQMPESFACTELWRVILGEAEGRRDPAQVTIFDSVGFALEDFSALHVMQDAARELGLGRKLDLIARSDDPRDLFGLIGGATSSRAAA
ncbi:ornithine cyclodeaminase [Alsobacter sp. SYSU M60028]|uniref:Ornithine cyclodeaminase n=1 Tax=Alsobacter ponti TaxID=2962936 RepID=A0ABT1LH79_9HYPH|nr:ornithine cyclodeaminase [Alsobacter ponti]MCP8940311.1 ornithine cyclodeaminase [Alsobacter ponti]